MSLAIHCQGFHNKDFYQFSRSIVWNHFKPISTWSPEGWELTYNGRYGGTLYLDDDELIDGFSIQRPSDPAIRDMYIVAQQVPSAINLDDAFFVADPAYLFDLPNWLLSALPRPPQVVSDADKLLEFLALI